MVGLRSLAVGTLPVAPVEAVTDTGHPPAPGAGELHALMCLRGQGVGGKRQDEWWERRLGRRLLPGPFNDVDREVDDDGQSRPPCGGGADGDSSETNRVLTGRRGPVVGLRDLGVQGLPVTPIEAVRDLRHVPVPRRREPHGVSREGSRVVCGKPQNGWGTLRFLSVWSDIDCQCVAGDSWRRTFLLRDGCGCDKACDVAPRRGVRMVGLRSLAVGTLPVAPVEAVQDTGHPPVPRAGETHALTWPRGQGVGGERQDGWWEWRLGRQTHSRWIRLERLSQRLGGRRCASP